MSKIVDSVIGLAMGDAMGVPLEFSIRKKLIEHPVTSMLGYGSHDVPAGSWSDDTTMTICEIESFNKNNKFDYDDIMKNYIKWAIKKKFESGKPQCRYKIYGYRWDGDNLVIEPEEAKIVKLIFQMYLNKVSAERMEIELKEMGVIATNGGYFNIGTIRDMLLNITYTGNLLLQKSYTPNPLVRRKVKNNGELPKYYVENNHEAIIPMEMFIQVQEERKRRKAEGQRANFGKNITCFSCRVKCPICGKNYMRNSRSKNSDGIKAHIWTCGTRLTGGSKACPGKTINEIALKRVSAKVLGLDEFDSNAFDEQIKKVIVIGDDLLEFHFNDGKIISEKWEYNARKEYWTEEKRRERGEKLKKSWRMKNDKKSNNDTSITK